MIVDDADADDCVKMMMGQYVMATNLSEGDFTSSVDFASGSAGRR